MAAYPLLAIQARIVLPLLSPQPIFIGRDPTLASLVFQVNVKLGLVGLC